MAFAAHLMPRTIRGQIMAIVVLAIFLVIVVGRVLEVVGENVLDVTDVESLSVRLGVMAELVQNAPPDQREALLDAASRAGYRFEIHPLAAIEDLPPAPHDRFSIAWVLNGILPADDMDLPDGQRVLLDGQNVLAFPLDAKTVLTITVPDTRLTVDVVEPLTYYLLSFVVMIFLFSMFAVRVVTEPLRVMSRSVRNADFGSAGEPFEERGALEIAGLAKALNDMRGRITALLATRTRMLRSVSHDLRTPLTRLRMRSERVPDAGLRDAMLSDIRRIDALMDETLNYLRDNDSVEQLQKANIASILQTICADFSDVGFPVTYDGPNRLIGVCKPNALTRAITNLCDNGVKFAENVVVSLKRGTDTLTITVADDGPGIAPEERAQVLEPFFKVDNARSSAVRNSGFGLGLSIVADIVRGHGGRLRFDDNDPSGLIVELELPLGLVPA